MHYRTEQIVLPMYHSTALKVLTPTISTHLTSRAQITGRKLHPCVSILQEVLILAYNPLTAGTAYIRVFILYSHIKYHILNMLKIKCDINQQDLKRVDLHFVKSK